MTPLKYGYLLIYSLITSIASATFLCESAPFMNSYMDWHTCLSIIREPPPSGFALFSSRLSSSKDWSIFNLSSAAGSFVCYC